MDGLVFIFICPNILVSDRVESLVSDFLEDSFLLTGIELIEDIFFSVESVESVEDAESVKSVMNVCSLKLLNHSFL